VRHDTFTVSIGRAGPRRRLQASTWAHPFKIGRDGTREQVVERYRRSLLSRPDPFAQQGDLRG
jgi:Domain of unknown function (DUF4326)